MCAAVTGVVDRTVPPPHRAVVQVEFEQLRRVGGTELDEVLDLGQQRREVADVLLEQIEHAGDPAFAEPHARAHTLVDQLRSAGVDGLREHRDPGFVPQPAADEQRRIRCHRHLCAGDRLRGVPRIGEPVRRHLQVQLHRRARGLGGDICELRRIPFVATELDLHVLSPRVDDRVAQRLVAVLLGHPLLVGEEPRGQRRQGPDRHRLEPVRLGGPLDPLQAMGDAGLERLQPAPGDLQHRMVELEVESADLRLVFLVEAGEHILVAQARLVLTVDEVELEFEPDGACGFEFRMAEVGIEQLEVLRELLPIQCALLRRVPLRVDFLTHRTSKPQTAGFARGSLRSRLRLRSRSHHPDGPPAMSHPP